MSTGAFAARWERSDRLRGWNLGTGSFHLAQGLVMLAIASGVTLPSSSSYPPPELT